ncbi:MAG: hypothetical protein JJE04_27050 [Acidobacteriia bacterium]|nr:hypothetical protein [Terriglobia bacterium]
MDRETLLKAMRVMGSEGGKARGTALSPTKRKAIRQEGRGRLCQGAEPEAA